MRRSRSPIRTTRCCSPGTTATRSWPTSRTSAAPAASGSGTCRKSASRRTKGGSHLGGGGLPLDRVANLATLLKLLVDKVNRDSRLDEPAGHLVVHRLPGDDHLRHGEARRGHGRAIPAMMHDRVAVR